MIIDSRAQVKKVKVQRRSKKHGKRQRAHFFNCSSRRSISDRPINAAEDFSIINNQRLAAELKHQQQLLALQSLPSIAPTQ